MIASSRLSSVHLKTYTTHTRRTWIMSLYADRHLFNSEVIENAEFSAGRSMTDTISSPFGIMDYSNQ